MEKFIFFEKEDLQNLIRVEVEMAVTAALMAEDKQQRGKNATPKYLDRQAAAEMLHISMSTLHRLVSHKHLKCRKVGRKTLFLLSDVEKVVLTINQ